MIPRPPPTKQQRKLETDLQLAQEDEVNAHGTLALLWRKVKTHSDWQTHLTRRDDSITRARTASASRARAVRKEAEHHKEEISKAREEVATEKSTSRLRVKGDPSVAALELDMRKKTHVKKRKEPSKEKLEQISQEWVTVGRGGYNYSDLTSANYLRAMMKAENEMHQSLQERELAAKKKQVAEIRKKEKLIMNTKAGVTAKYHLSSSVTKTKEGEEKDQQEQVEEQEQEKPAEQEEEEEEGSNAHRKSIPGVKGLFLPEFHKSEGKALKKDLIREKKCLKNKTKQAEKHTQQDIDAAAKLLILHAHMLRKACVEAKKATAAETGETEK